MNRKPWATLALSPRPALLATPALAQNATRDDATAMVKMGVAFIKANGVEKAYAEITAKSPQFVKNDSPGRLRHDGKCLAHGANEKQVGKDLIDLKDGTARPLCASASSWQEQNLRASGRTTSSPTRTTKKIEPSRCTCERLGETWSAAGPQALILGDRAWSPA